MPSSTARTARLRSAAWAAAGNDRVSSSAMPAAYDTITPFAYRGDNCSQTAVGSSPLPGCVPAGRPRPGRSGLDQDLHVLVLVLDQLVEAAIDELVELDPLGDEEPDVDQVVGQQPDGGRVVAQVADD